MFEIESAGEGTPEEIRAELGRLRARVAQLEAVIRQPSWPALAAEQRRESPRSQLTSKW